MTLVAVVLGGILGTGLRLTINQLVAPDSAFPWATLLINVVGSFVLGLLVARVWPTAPGWLRAGLGTGLLGSFTLLAVVYLVASLALGLAAALLGVRLGARALVAPPIEADE
jgi:CrcB protein